MTTEFDVSKFTCSSMNLSQTGLAVDYCGLATKSCEFLATVCCGRGQGPLQLGRLKQARKRCMTQAVGLRICCVSPEKENQHNACRCWMASGLEIRKVCQLEVYASPGFMRYCRVCVMMQARFALLALSDVDRDCHPLSHMVQCTLQS